MDMALSCTQGPGVLIIYLVSACKNQPAIGFLVILNTTEYMNERQEGTKYPT